MLLFELNEYNAQLLSDCAQIFRLKNIQKLLTWNKTQVHTDDVYASDYLEPWVQWVSTHTGAPSTVHQIKHLGDVPHLSQKQLWEELADRGVTSGIWGVMNGNRRCRQNIKFFLPDPWTYSEPGYPEQLNKLLELPRYVSKNYLNLSFFKTTSLFFKLLSILLFSRTLLRLIAELPRLVRNALRFKFQAFVFISFVDYILTSLFLEFKKRFAPQFTVIFLNSLAHIQHHHWYSGRYQENAKLKIGVQYIDRILDLVFRNLDPIEPIICFTALSQKNSTDDDPWVLYRQKDQGKFLKTIGVKFLKVEPHMTHDAHIFFESEEDCSEAVRILKNATVQNDKLFLVEEYPADKSKIFYRINFTDPVSETTTFTANGKAFVFLNLFKGIVVRTGKHIQDSVAFCNQPLLPEKINNHDLYQHIIKYFDRRWDTAKERLEYAQIER